MKPYIPDLGLLPGERQELERLHSERLSKLRTREEEMGDKLKRQQVGVSACALRVLGPDGLGLLLLVGGFKGNDGHVTKGSSQSLLPCATHSTGERMARQRTRQRVRCGHPERVCCHSCGVPTCMVCVACPHALTDSGSRLKYHDV